MKIVVGLGNMGKKYEQTRHNAGFCVLDSMAASWNLEWKMQIDETGMATEHSSRRVWLFKPYWFMNRSGEALQRWIDYRKFDKKELELVVIHDDLDLPLGKIQLRQGGGAAGHRGVVSVKQLVSDWDKVWRMRLGVGRPAPGVSATEIINDWVLSRVGGDQVEVWEKMIAEAAWKIEKLVQ